jgi:hypothetical protein
MKRRILIGAFAATLLLLVSSAQRADAFELLSRLGIGHGHGCGCCAPEPTCCEPEPVCCEPEPVCCEPEPVCDSCGCDSCGHGHKRHHRNRCGCGKRHGLFHGLFHHKNSCGCGCEVEVSCGCGG